MKPEDPQFLDLGTGSAQRQIAVRAREGAAPGIVWLGGFKSDMQGTKAQALAAWAEAKGRACVRFDYSGHGESGGDFSDGTIGRWLEESVAVFDRFCRGPQVLVGSSMGGWIALLLARELRRRATNAASVPLAGMVLIAPAVDFTEELMWKKFPDGIKREIETTGQWIRPSEYDPGGYPITRGLIEALGMWRFFDERPLEPEEVIAAVQETGEVMFQKTLWPLFLTQQLVVARKS